METSGVQRACSIVIFFLLADPRDDPTLANFLKLPERFNCGVHGRQAEYGLLVDMGPSFEDGLSFGKPRGPWPFSSMTIPEETKVSLRELKNQQRAVLKRYVITIIREIDGH
mmetsp:Transcript_30100/g.62928  ORF Transcript_30100/g.62928 Transcript_30100/m.62928 type:complete len:112 (+) Transcript_30100:1-336(+)